MRSMDIGDNRVVASPPYRRAAGALMRQHLRLSKADLPRSRLSNGVDW
jgi:hypothetical protein